jgi:hypothetical protein
VWYICIYGHIFDLVFIYSYNVTEKVRHLKCLSVTENTASNNSSIVVMDGCLAIAHILLMRLLAVTKQRMSLLAIIA